MLPRDDTLWLQYIIVETLICKEARFVSYSINESILSPYLITALSIPDSVNQMSSRSAAIASGVTRVELPILHTCSRRSGIRRQTWRWLCCNSSATSGTVINRWGSQSGRDGEVIAPDPSSNSRPHLQHYGTSYRRSAWREGAREPPEAPPRLANLNRGASAAAACVALCSLRCSNRRPASEATNIQEVSALSCRTGDQVNSTKISHVLHASW